MQSQQYGTRGQSHPTTVRGEANVTIRAVGQSPGVVTAGTARRGVMSVDEPGNVREVKVHPGACLGGRAVLSLKDKELLVTVPESARVTVLQNGMRISGPVGEARLKTAFGVTSIKPADK